MSGETILIIDDSREMVNHLSTQLLPAFGYKTLHATNGREGLGLTLARSIAEAHGGCVTVESEPGQGSTFILVLPASSS